MASEAAEAYGLRFQVPPNDTAIGACLRDHGEFARPEVDFLAAFAGDFIDVGANIGAICIPIAKAEPSKRIVAVEAQPQVAALLRANITANEASNITLIEAVAGETAGVVHIPLLDVGEARNIGATSLYEKGRPTVPTRMVRLDNIAPPNIGIVKIDVEGFEPRVLQGATILLNDRRPSWLVEVSRDRPNTAAAVRALLQDAGYRLFWFFSPFVTAARNGEARGDMAIFASDADPPWDLPAFGDAWPSDAGAFPYLAKYGVVSGLRPPPG